MKELKLSFTLLLSIILLSVQFIIAQPAHLVLPKKHIKVALLLDTSNSMDGLIDQAKAQLWDIVN